MSLTARQPAGVGDVSRVRYVARFLRHMQCIQALCSPQSLQQVGTAGTPASAATAGPSDHLAADLPASTRSSRFTSISTTLELLVELVVPALQDVALQPESSSNADGSCKPAAHQSFNACQAMQVLWQTALSMLEVELAGTALAVHGNYVCA